MIGQRTMETQFQSTLSVRRATVTRGHIGVANISIHALREESDESGYALYVVGTVISIHALREESDFLSTVFNIRNYISIHALREESDSSRSCRDNRPAGISIHALREESDA